jgi:hypothetical protein
MVVARTAFAFAALLKSLLINLAPFWDVVDKSLVLRVSRKVVMDVIFSAQSRTFMAAEIL